MKLNKLGKLVEREMYEIAEKTRGGTGIYFSNAENLQKFVNSLFSQAFKEVIPKKKSMSEYESDSSMNSQAFKKDGFNSAIDQFKKNIKDYLEEK